LSPIDVKKDARYAISGKRSSHFMQAFSDWTASWHSDGPAKLNLLDAFPNQAPVFRNQ